MARRFLIVLAAAGIVAGVLAAPAQAAVWDGGGLPVAVLGIDFPSVRSIVEDVVEFFFGTLLDALVPDFLRDAALGALKYLIAAPNPADARAWPTISLLADQLRTVGYALLPVTLAVSVTRAFVSDMLDAGHDSPLRVVGRAVSSGFALVIYRWAFSNSIAAINIVTSALIGLPVVERGLERTVGLVFGASIFSGGGVLLSLLGLVAVVLAIGLFVVKVALFTLYGVWYVAGQFLLSLRPLPEVEPFVRAWKFGFVALLAVPIGWCILFALAGSLSLDLTGGNAMNGPMGSKLIGAFTTIIVFYLAVRWPFLVLGQLRSLLGPGLGLRGIRLGGSGNGGRGAGPAVVRDARAKLQRAALAGGRMVMSPLPGGGLVGLGAKAGRSIMPRVGAVAGKIPGAAAAASAVAPAATPLAAAAGAIRARARAGGQAIETALRAGMPAAAVAGAGASAALKTPTPTRRSATAPSDDPSGRTSASTTSTGAAVTRAPLPSARSTTTPVRRLSAEQRAVMKALGPHGDDPVIARNVRDAAPGEAAREAIATAERQGERLPADVHDKVVAAAGPPVRPTASTPQAARPDQPVSPAASTAAAATTPSSTAADVDGAPRQGAGGPAPQAAPTHRVASASRRSARAAGERSAPGEEAADQAGASAAPRSNRRRRTRRSPR